MANYTVHIMLAMLGMSLILLVLQMRRLMFLGMACTFLLAILLKTASNVALKFPEVNHEEKIRVAHFNLSNFESDIEVLMDFIPTDSIDVLSFQEVTPYWEKKIITKLADQYPYYKSVVRIDPYGLALFSRKPFSEVDTFMVKEVPNLMMTIEKGSQSFRIISSYITPALNRKTQKLAEEQLKEIADRVVQSEKPVISLGDFNMVYWTHEIRSYLSKTKLINSRRDIMRSNLRVPYDHIFFSNDLQCVAFSELQDTLHKHIGIIGTYQPLTHEKQQLTGISPG